MLGRSLLISERSLAEEWESTPYTAVSTYRTALSSITLFLLLDLLGSADPKVPSYFKTTHWAYQEMAGIELRLRSLGALQSSPANPFLPEIYKDRTNFDVVYGIEDDHIPFLARGVEVLHVIPSPFPHGIWHTMNDDGEHLDMPTVEDWAKIVTAFVGEWMDLEGYFPSKGKAEAQIKEERTIFEKTEL